MGRLTGIGLQFSRSRISSSVPKIVGPFAVHLVDEGDPRHAVLVGLMPDGLALGLDAFAGAEDHHAAVEHPQAPLHLGGEIDVAGRVDQVDLDVLPGEGDRGGVDRDAPLLLLGVVVGDGGALVDLAHAVAEAAVEQHPLGDGGLAGVDVGDHADVAEVVEVGGHGGIANWKLKIGNCKLEKEFMVGFEGVEVNGFGAGGTAEQSFDDPAELGHCRVSVSH